MVANRALSMMYMATGRAADAEKPLKIVAEDTKGGAGKLALADYYYLGVNRIADARALLETIARGQENVSDAKIRLAAIADASGDRPGAYKQIAEVLEKEPKNIQALVIKSQLQLADGQPAEALNTARAAVNVNPQSPEAQLALGHVLAVTGQIDEAVASSKDALKANPRFAPAAIELARLSLLQGKPAEAADYARTALDVAAVAA